MHKTFTILVILFISVAILISLGRQIAWSLEAGKRLDSAVDTITQLQNHNRDLKKKLAQVSTPDYSENLLRDKLNLAKPNETIVVIPDEVLNKVLGAKKVAETVKIPNWQGWLKLFMH